MNVKTTKDVSFDDVDFSKYQDEINEIQKLYEELKNDKKFEWALKKYRKIYVEKYKKKKNSKK